MRSPLRSILASSIVAVALLAIGTTSALAGNATPGRYTFGDAWCFDDVVLQYCFDNQHTLQVVEFADGDSFARISSRERTVVYRNGAVVAESLEISNDRSVFLDGGLASMHTVSHVRYAGDGVTCSSTYLLKITDYELQIDRWNGPGCS
jgi:hypothetical protein